MWNRKKRPALKKPNPMIVLSWDAVGSEDISYLKELPHFSSLLKRGAFCDQVKSVCPSLTYPAHATIVTGKTPAHHGIVNNLRFQPEREKPDWFWQRKFIHGTTLFDEARKAGLTTAALLWPVASRSRITYNLPEVWANRPWQNQLMMSFFHGTPGYELDLFRRYGSMIDGIRQPMLDNFVQASLLRTFRGCRPDLMLVHLTDVDTTRHSFGVHSREARAALRRQDLRLGETLGMLKKINLEKKTNIIILGDHYQKDVSCILYPNYFIVEKGWAEKKGNALGRWKVAAQNADGACYIYLRDNQDRELKQEVANWLSAWKNAPDSPVQAVFTGKQARDKGADPQCAFMLEAKEGFYFGNGCSRPKETIEENSSLHRGAHGYCPDAPGYETFFLAAGPDFQPGARIEKMYLMDEGPIMARALGLDLEDADGAVLNAFFPESH